MKRLAAGFMVAASVTWAGNALAINFEYGEFDVGWTTKITAGAAWRTSARDAGKVGKLNIPGQQNLCSNQFGGGDDCISLSGDPEPNQRFVDARGGYFAALLDDGNLNYDRGDLVSSVFKINTELNLNWQDWLLKLNYVAFYDHTNYNLDVTHVNTQYQPAREARRRSVRSRAGANGEFREAFILKDFEIGDRFFSLTVGQQRVRWGEANLHLFNTMDAINPLDAILPLQPGFDLAELAVPTGMVLLTGDVLPNVTAEVFYQYDWDGTNIWPSGSFLSPVDPVGIENYNAVLSLGQFPEDPNGQFNPGNPFSLLSSSTRIAEVREDGFPARDDGQFGVRINWYAENLNDGTEFGFYFLNYHSRLPYFSIFETTQTCLRNVPPALDGQLVAALAACQGFNGTLNPLPPDPADLILEYPEDIQMFGVSFNTTAFGWSVSGEYAYRPNVPGQILISDVFYAGFQQAFARQDIPLNPLGVQIPNDPFLGELTQNLLDGVIGAVVPGISVDTIVPSASTFIPSRLIQYRGRTADNTNEYQPGEYVRGWEDLQVGQFVINALKLFPSTFGSDDVTLLAEVGFTHVIDMPSTAELPIQGTLEHTHPSPGADCTGFAEGTDCQTAQVTARINPTQQTDGFADDFAAGFRMLLQFKYSNVMNSGVTIKPTLIWMEDIYGIAPFPIQNYVEGNRWMVPGIQFEIGQAFNGTLLYNYYDGADNQVQDRDNVSVSITYNF
ncbi:MAG: DUF1302 domain-containing protein [Panacagrimonas sp.]